MSFFSGITERAILAGQPLRTTPVGLTVLIVHPQHLVRNTLAVTLGMFAPRTGSVLEAATAADALSQLRSNAVDLVFCSLGLGDAPGAEVLERLAPALRNTDLALMQDGDAGVVENAVAESLRLRLRLRGILSHPVTRAEVGRIMERAPARRRAESPATVQGPGAHELEEALEERQIEVHYLPTFSIANRRMIAVEALARWNHPQRGLLDARHFIALAERSGLMPGLTLQVARQALQQIAEWRSQGLALSLSLNLSTVGLDDMDLPELLAGAAESVGVSPQWVMLELSEHQMAHFTTVYGTLSRLRNRGFRLALDHFGVADSSVDLNLLRRLQITELKIDRSLVTGAAASRRRLLLADAVEVGRRLDMRVVGTGVESIDDWSLLAGLGCNAAQGYYISRPLVATRVPQQKGEAAAAETGPDAGKSLADIEQEGVTG